MLLNAARLSFILILIGCLLTIKIKAADDDKLNNQENYQVEILKVSSQINVDGILNESEWKNAKPAKDFNRKWPVDTGLAEAKTEVKLLYDENFIYISAICYIEETPIITTLKRDVGHWSSDGIAIVLDPVNQRTNGFMFGVNAGGAQIEGLISVSDASWEWDTKWYSAVKRNGDHWIAEMAIPFKSLRYSEDVNSWGINFIRNDMQRNAYSTWARVPLQYDGIDLGYTGRLLWNESPKPTKGNIAIIPFVSGGVTKNHEDNEDAENNLATGLDAKIAITSTLNLDLTIKPDFSQVEVDQQVTNLSRFSVFFPERRNFFLENNDIFANFGSRPVRPFFSRKIGIHDGESVPILFGARLSGNLNKDLRVGVMTMQTDAIEDFAAQNYSVTALQHRVMKRSNVKAMLVNRQAYVREEGGFQKNDYNRVAALEFNYLSENGKWGGNASYHKTYSNEKHEDNGYMRFAFNRNSKNFSFFTGYIDLGTNYVADVGFTQRLGNYDAENDTTIRIGYKQAFGWFQYRFFPKSKTSKLNNYGFNTWNSSFWNQQGKHTEYINRITYFMSFKNSSFLEARFKYNEVKLPFKTEIIGLDTIYKTDPITMEVDTIPEQFLPSEKFNYISGEINYNSDNRKKVFFSAGVEYGQFYNGTKLTYRGSLNYRVQPWGNFTFGFRRDIIKLADGFGESKLLLLNPRIEISFSEKMFWTTFFQYNLQGENFNINSRFQWRFRPMSDFFLVYTDNYFAENLKIKNRAIVFKINYWLNL